MTFQRPLLVFAGVSLAAVALGAVVCAISGVPAALWIRNLTAWAVGGLAAAAIARLGGRRAADVALLAAPVGLAATMFNPPQDGVHRWLDLGPLHVNAAMLLLPSFVVAASAVQRPKWWWIPALLSLAILALQPDASQTTALALAVCVAAFGREAMVPRFAIALAALALAAFSWTRRDPLQPVPEVEEIVQLAASHSPLLAGLAVMLLVAFAAAPALASRAGQSRTAGLALTALLLGWIAAPALGAFPVPLVGVGLSPILGAWLGLGLLAATARTARA